MLGVILLFLVSPQDSAFGGAKTAYEREDFELARKKIEQFLIKYPDTQLAPEALYLAARLRRTAGEALTYYEKILAKYPKSQEAPHCLYAIAQYHYALAEYRKALEIYEKIIASYPNSEVAQASESEVERLASFIFVQLGYFAEEKNAHRLADKLKEFHPSIIKDGAYYRVWIGPFSSSEEAKDFMLQKGLKGITKKLK